MAERSTLARFWSKVAGSEDPDACWTWTAYRSENGYGRFSVTVSTGKYRLVTAHRFAYEIVNGPIPDGLELDHTCSNRACVNPAHLEPVTHHENVLRGRLCTSTTSTCSRGHSMTESNTYTPPGRKTRVCRTCQADRSRARYRDHLAHLVAGRTNATGPL